MLVYIFYRSVIDMVWSLARIAYRGEIEDIISISTLNKGFFTIGLW